MKTACTVQCPQCPFRPDALPSYLGDYTATAITQSLWRNVPFFCHTKVNYGNPGWKKVAQAKGKLCLGSMVFANKLHAPMSPDAYPESDRDVIIAREANQDRTDVQCMEVKQFLDHHDPTKAVANLKKVKAKRFTSTKPKLPKPLPKLKGTPTQTDIEAEIEMLKLLKPLITPQSMFGDDNLQSIQDAIDVLTKRMDEDDVYDRYDLVREAEESDADERDIINEADKRSNERADHAMDTVRWMEGDSSERPSDGWRGLAL